MDQMGPEGDTVTPTLLGRLQTRLFLLLTVGLAWTLVIGPVLPRPAKASLGDVYQSTLWALGIVAVVGIAWELIYHGLQQYRWEKDWPTLFGLLTGINEGVLTWLILELGLVGSGSVPMTTFVPHFVSTWILVWLAANGPMRVFFPRWRFRGGRIL